MNDLHHRIPSGHTSGYRSMTDDLWKRCCAIILDAAFSLGYSLRLHNSNHPEAKVTINDIVRDITEGHSSLSVERCAAVNNLQCIQAICHCLNVHKLQSSRWTITEPYSSTYYDMLNCLYRWIPDITNDVWNAGYNVLGAESCTPRRRPGPSAL